MLKKAIKMLDAPIVYLDEHPAIVALIYTKLEIKLIDRIDTIKTNILIDLTK